MKKILLLAVMGIGFLGASAQDGKQKQSPKKQRYAAKAGYHRGEKMDSILQLTEAQKLQLKALQTEYQQKRMAVYTPEQKAKLEQFQKQRANRMKKGDHHKSPMVSNLTDEQKNSMRTLQKKQKEEAQLIKANTALSEAEKKAKLSALREANRENMRKILTPEQVQELKQRSKRSMDGPAR